MEIQAAADYPVEPACPAALKTMSTLARKSHENTGKDSHFPNRLQYELFYKRIASLFDPYIAHLEQRRGPTTKNAELTRKSDDSYKCL